MSMFPEKCERCNGSFEVNGCKIHTTSMFNKEQICMACKEREKAHPKYKEALEADRAEIKKGNYNFEGIGCPPELYEKEGNKMGEINFVVICCAERTIYSLGTATTQKEAYALMKRDVINHLGSCGDEEYIAVLGAENETVYIEDTDDFGISSLGAWSNLDTDKNLDWAIIKLSGGSNNE